MQDFRNLKVWEKSHDLVLEVYRATEGARRGKYPGLIPQLRRAAAAIPTNIAEGCGHTSQRELARFLQIAMASASELEYHLILAADLGAIGRAAHLRLQTRTQEVKRMLTSLIHTVRSDLKPLSTDG